MAALNTLRTKGALFMSISIAFALLAFLVSDGNFFDQNPNIVVGTINGKEVSLKDYMERVDKGTLFNQFVSGGASTTSEMTEQLNENVWQQMVLDNIFDASLANLGFAVGDDEMVDMATGKYISPVLQSMFSDQQGQYSKENLSSFVSSMSMDPSGKATQFWDMVEEQIVKERQFIKYFALVTAGEYVTNLEAEQSVAKNSSKFDVKYVIVPASSQEVEVSDSEIKNFYEANKNRYSSTPFTEIEYVVFESTPSQEDYAEGQKSFDELLAEFKTTDNIQQFVDLNSEEKFDGRYYSEKNISPAYLEFAFGKNSDDVMVAEFAGDIHSAVRIADSKMMPDSITVRALPLPLSVSADSIVSALKSKKTTIADVAEKYAMTSIETLEPMTINTSDMADERLFNTKEGDFVNLGNMGGMNTIVHIVKADKPIKKVRIAKLILTVSPSNKTEQEFYSQAAMFADKVNADGSKFDEVVSESGLVKRVAKVFPADRKVNNIEGTREIVRFAYNSKENQVSNIITSGSSNYVVINKTIFKDDFLPLEDVKDDIKQELTNTAKVNKLKAEMASISSLDDAASKFDVEVATAEDLSYASFFVPGIGIAPEMLATLSDIAPNTLSEPVRAGEGVVLYEVTSVKPNAGVTVDSEKSMLNNINITNIEYRVSNSLQSKSNIVDDRVLYM